MPSLTRKLAQHIVSSIRSGGYAHVAAQAWEVPPELLDEWLRLGALPDAGEPFATFAREVLQAQAQARLRAEVAAFENDPKAWLNHGPGRESEARPGWSAQVKAAEAAAVGGNPLLDPHLLELFRHVLGLLAAYPEIRGKVADALSEHGLLAEAA